jgi:O-antigen ligase
MPDAVAKTASVTAWDAAAGTLLFASTLYFASNALILGVLALLLLRHRVVVLDSSLLFVAAFSLLALINLALHLPAFDAAQHGSAPAVLLVAVCAALAPALTRGALKVFVLWTCLEVGVGVVEYLSGQVALTAAQSELASQDIALDSDLLYDLRVFGLSANSSLLAEKVFLSIALVLGLAGLFRLPALVLAVLAAGLFVSFNRTAIACTVLLLLLSLRPSRLGLGRSLLLLLLTAAAAAWLAANVETVLLQFARGNLGELSYSELSRLYFWERSLEVIAQAPLTGNGSLTFRIEDLVTGVPQHAHNSFLMLAATHGLLPAAFMLAYVLVRTNRTNWRIVVAFMAFSATQYFVFWNLSVPDMMLFWWLAQRPAPAATPRFEVPLRVRPRAS